MSKQSTYVAGQVVTLTNGQNAIINSIKGRWVNVTNQSTDKTHNVGFKDIAGLYEAASSAERKNGVVKADYLSNYQRVKLEDGSVVRDNGDDAATILRGVELDEAYKVVAKKLGVTQISLHEQYDHLNAGMQRMNLGNRLRKALRDADKAAAAK